MNSSIPRKHSLEARGALPVTLIKLPLPAFDGASPEETTSIDQTAWAALIDPTAESALRDWEDDAQVSFRQEWFDFCFHTTHFI